MCKPKNRSWTACECQEWSRSKKCRNIEMQRRPFSKSSDPPECRSADTYFSRPLSLWDHPRPNRSSSCPRAALIPADCSTRQLLSYTLRCREGGFCTDFVSSTHVNTDKKIFNFSLPQFWNKKSLEIEILTANTHLITTVALNMTPEEHLKNVYLTLKKTKTYRKHPNLHYLLFMHTLNNRGPKHDSWGTPWNVLQYTVLKVKFYM